MPRLGHEAANALSLAQRRQLAALRLQRDRRRRSPRCSAWRRRATSPASAPTTGGGPWPCSRSRSPPGGSTGSARSRAGSGYVGAIALSFWLLVGVQPRSRAATRAASRYQYIGGIFVLLIAAELVRGRPPRPVGVRRSAARSIALAVLSNLYVPRPGGEVLRGTSDLIRRRPRGGRDRPRHGRPGLRPHRRSSRAPPTSTSRPGRLPARPSTSSARRPTPPRRSPPAPEAARRGGGPGARRRARAAGSPRPRAQPAGRRLPRRWRRGATAPAVVNRSARGRSSSQGIGSANDVDLRLRRFATRAFPIGAGRGGRAGRCRSRSRPTAPTCRGRCRLSGRGEVVLCETPRGRGGGGISTRRSGRDIHRPPQ